MEEASSYLQTFINWLISATPSFLLAIGVLIIGFWIVNKLAGVVRKSLEKANFSSDIVPFLVSILEIAGKVLICFSVAGIVGIDTASFVAILAAAGFAIGLSLQGSLGNFAAGIIILVFRPYKVNDWIEVQDRFGRVEEIQIFNTIMATPGMKTLIVPNGEVINGIVTNFSSKGNIRLELNVTMPYEESFPRIQKIIIDALLSIPKVLKDPPPEVGIESFDSHNIILAVRPYANPDDYWEVTFEAHRLIKKAFSEHNVTVAYSEGVEIGKIGE